MDYEGLIVFTHPDYPFTWAGWDWTRTRGDTTIRVELFERPCRVCDEPYIATVKLPKFAIERYKIAAEKPRHPVPVRVDGRVVDLAPPPPLEVRVKLPPMRWYGGLALRTCAEHRGIRRRPELCGPPLPAWWGLV